MTLIVLSGYVYQDADGVFVSHCNELGIDACGDSLEDVQFLTIDMLQTYFAAARKLGTYDREIEALRVKASQRHVSATEGAWRVVPDLANLKFVPEYFGSGLRP